MDFRQIKQISLSRSARDGKVVQAMESDPTERLDDLAQLQQSLLQYSIPWPFSLDQHLAPHPIYVPPSLIQEVQLLQIALDKALTDIVCRWYSDEESNFPRRMGIKPHEDSLLRWMNGNGAPFVRDFSQRKGCWRPDILIEQARDSLGNLFERVRICEINGRFPFNGFLVSAYSGLACEALGSKQAGLRRTADIGKILPAIMDLFDESKPLYVLREKWPAADIHLLKDFYEEKTGQPMKMIVPSQVRCLPENTSPTGYALYCERESSEGDEKSLERIHQISLELYQDEYEQFDPITLQQLATICINDMRSIFLVHDKRMLAIVLEEIEGMIAPERSILTSEEYHALKNGIAPSTVSSSPSWNKFGDQCRANPQLKNDFVLKAIRSGFGKGHIFGSDVTNDEWLQHLDEGEGLTSEANEDTHTLQRRIEQVEYEIIRHGIEEVEKFYLVGSYLNVTGKYVGMGPFRIGRKSHIPVNETDRGIIVATFTDV